jgi:hypothetical protein
LRQKHAQDNFSEVEWAGLPHVWNDMLGHRWRRNELKLLFLDITRNYIALRLSKICNFACVLKFPLQGWLQNDMGAAR